jgi:hypothetical protein
MSVRPGIQSPSGRCHSEPFAVILSEAKDLALGAEGKLREESRSEPVGLKKREPGRDSSLRSE